MNQHPPTTPLPDPALPRFSVVCVAENGSYFRINVAAATAEEAAEFARKQGHIVAITYIDGLARAEQNRLLGVLRRDGGKCLACGYALEGLPKKAGVVICPECGYGDPIVAAERAAARNAEPGRLLVRAGVFLGVVEILIALRPSDEWPVVAAIGLALCAAGYERSKGSRGMGALVFVGLVIVFVVVRRWVI